MLHGFHYPTRTHLLCMLGICQRHGSHRRLVSYLSFCAIRVQGRVQYKCLGLQFPPGQQTLHASAVGAIWLLCHCARQCILCGLNGKQSQVLQLTADPQVSTADKKMYHAMAWATESQRLYPQQWSRQLRRRGIMVMVAAPLWYIGWRQTAHAEPPPHDLHKR